MKIENLCFGYKSAQPIFNNLNIEIPNNSIYFLLGPNGAGKTTLLNLIAGKLKYNTGEIIHNSELSDNDIFFMQDVPYFYKDLTAQINLEIFCDYLDLSYDNINNVLEKVGLSDSNKKIKEYSLGMQKRLNIAMMMLSDSSINLLDEPLNGLDPHGIILLREYIIAENRNNNKTFVISSHLLNEIGNFCTHYGIIERGNLLTSGENNAADTSLEQIYLSNIKYGDNYNDNN